MASKAGKEMIPPPPAIESRRPAIKPAKDSMMRVKKFIVHNKKPATKAGFSKSNKSLLVRKKNVSSFN
ncbi:MAG: hypothetical protein ABIE74_04100 [Pseudomonadota bacterium]